MGKVLGYALIIAIFVSAAYFLAVGQKGGEGSKSSNKQVQSTPTPVVNGTKIVVYAAGTQANNEYPTMELKIDGNVVTTWKNVKGDARNGKFDEFVYNYQNNISNEEIQVGFINDLYIAADEDRNLYVDRITVAGNTYVADSPATLTTITDKTNKNCSADGSTYSRWLRCNGYFTFRNFDKAFEPEATPKATLLNGSVVKVYAAGKSNGGDYPIFDVNIKGKRAASFKAIGDPNKRLLGEYTFLYPEKVVISDISIMYMNDYYGGVNDDRNLFVDRVNLDGVDYFADTSTVYQTGVWRGNVCAEGYLRSKVLWCQGGTMRFGARATPTPSK